MEKQSIPAAYAFFKKLTDADDKLREESRSMESTLTNEQEMSLYSRQQAFTIAIDLWDGLSKGIANYEGLLTVYRRFHEIMESNSASDDLFTGKPNPDAYKDILNMLEETGINFNEKD